MIHNAAKGVSRSVIIDGKKTSMKNINVYKRVLEAENKNGAVIDYTFPCINSQNFTISMITNDGSTRTTHIL